MRWCTAGRPSVGERRAAVEPGAADQPGNGTEVVRRTQTGRLRKLEHTWLKIGNTPVGSERLMECREATRRPSYEGRGDRHDPSCGPRTQPAAAVGPTARVGRLPRADEPAHVLSVRRHS